MNIYTFGDPQLMQEALLALATIFNLVNWSDPGAAFGLGGNMLAVLLIGLIGALIVGMANQTVPVHFLFIAMILFGIGFGIKTDVTVEDVQTGAGAVVADVPIAVAAVASAASSAARELTIETSTALQRPASNTSLITQGGFLDPFRVLLATRDLKPQDLDVYLDKSLAHYWRFCVGTTMNTDPTIFDMDAFRADPQPADYLLSDVNVSNFSTTYFSDAFPTGVFRACWDANDDIRNDIDEIADGTRLGVEQALALALGNENFNTSFDDTDIDLAIDLLTRGGIDGQEFMTQLLVKNYYNTGEAFRLAEFGSNQAQYVAQMTQAFEDRKEASAIKGSTFLQYMMPTMTLFQFLFVMLAPIVALVMLAASLSAAKVLGGYLLFGVWTYSWMPVAAVVNHYMEISFMNAFEFSNVVGLGTGFTSILGFDDFYNHVSTRLAIGSDVLSSTPIILAAVLSGAVFGITRLAGGGSTAAAGAGGGSLSTPKLAQNQPVASIGGRSSTPYGYALSRNGIATAPSQQERVAYHTAGFSSATSSQRSAANSFRESARSSYESGIKTELNQLQTQASATSIGGTLQSSYTQRWQQQVLKQLKEGVATGKVESIDSTKIEQLATRLGAGFAIGGGIHTSSLEGFSHDQQAQRAENYARENLGSIASGVASSYAADSSLTKAKRNEFSDLSRRLEGFQQLYGSSLEFARQLSESSESLSKHALESVQDNVDHIKLGHAQGASHSDIDNIVREAGGAEYLKSFQDDSHQEWIDKGRPLSIDGTHRKSSYDESGTRFAVLSNRASQGDLVAYKALIDSYNLFSGSAIEGFDLPKGFEQEFSSTNFDQSRAEISEAALGSKSGTDAHWAHQQNSINSVFDRANERLGDTGAFGVSDTAADRIDEAAAAGRSSVNNPDSLRGLGDIPSRVSGAEREFSGSKQGALGERDTKWARQINNLITTEGFREEHQRQLGSLIAADSRSVGDGDAIEVLATFDGALRAQNGEPLAVDTYRGYRNAGLSPKEAAIATFGEIGKKTPDYQDVLWAGLAGVAGYKAIQKGAPSSKLGTAIRVGGPAVAAGAFLTYAALEVHEGKLDAQQARVDLGGQLKAEFRQANPEAAEEFAYEIDQAKDVRDVTDVIFRYYKEGRITDDQLASLDPNSGTSNSLWGRQSQTYNPFGER